jgi:GST-like protein
MIHLYYWPTPNGHKASIMLEETGLPYQVHPVNILAGEQFEPGFLAISPNNRIPAIVDDDANGGRVAICESGAILIYLAERMGGLLPAAGAARYRTLQWLMFQVAHVGPMFGQCGHFRGYAPEAVPYAIDRYCGETLKLYGIMDRQLAVDEYLAGDYSIADIAVLPWVAPKVRQLHQIDVDEFPNVMRWIGRMMERPAVQRGMQLLEGHMKLGNPTDEAREALFGERQRGPR